jgi:uncharacterized peroxidase-related enzyme
MFLDPPAPSADTARLERSDLAERGHVMNLTRLWSWRPEVFEGFAALRSQLTSASSLAPRELAVIVSATAAELGDSYCALAWGKLLAQRASPAGAAAVIRDNHHSESIELTARDRALARWARQLVADPNATNADDVEHLRAAGFSEREIFEATVFVAFRIAFSTVNDALGARPDRQVADAAPPEVRAAVTFGRPVAEAGS